MEFWAQRTVSPVDGREGWTVVDDDYVEHDQVAEYLRSVLDRGGSVGTARTYAGRLALWLWWASAGGADAVAPSGEQLAAFARWLERTPSRKPAVAAVGGVQRMRTLSRCGPPVPRRRSTGSSRRWRSSFASVRRGAGAGRRTPGG